MNVVDISNLALSHIANSAEVTSIDPPDGSAEADHCARFYPVARDLALESHGWSFAKVRKYLSELASNPMDGIWAYAYGVPNQMLRPLAVLLPGTGATAPSTSTYTISEDEPSPLQVDSQPFLLETNPDDGSGVLYTNVEDAILLYIYRQTDPTKFTPGFTVGLSTLLASFLAGPIAKDIKLKQGLRQIAMSELGAAAAMDKAQKVNTYRDFTPSHIAARS